MRGCPTLASFCKGGIEPDEEHCRNCGSSCAHSQSHPCKSRGVGQPQFVSFPTNTFFAAANSFFFAASTSGYARSSDSSASITTADTTIRVNHLLSAGTTYHGACLLAVPPIISS